MPILAFILPDLNLIREFPDHQNFLHFVCCALIPALITMDRLRSLFPFSDSPKASSRLPPAVSSADMSGGFHTSSDGILSAKATGRSYQHGGVVRIISLRKSFSIPCCLSSAASRPPSGSSYSRYYGSTLRSVTVRDIIPRMLCCKRLLPSAVQYWR